MFSYHDNKITKTLDRKVYVGNNTISECTLSDSGPLFTKRADVLPPDLVMFWSREIRIWTFPSALTFDRHIGSSSAELPVNFQSDTITVISDHAASRVHKIWWYDMVRRDVENGLLCVCKSMQVSLMITLYFVSGPGNGMTVTLNIEQYDYTSDPADGSGVQVRNTTG